MIRSNTRCIVQQRALTLITISDKNHDAVPRINYSNPQTERYIMNNHLSPNRRARKLIATLAFTLVVVTSAFAQQAQMSTAIVDPLRNTSARSVEPATVSLYDFPNSPEAAHFKEMDSHWWKDVRKTNIKALRESDTRTQALININYLASFFPKQSRFQRASNDLYRIYRKDRNQQHRVLALAILEKVGSEDVMRAMARDLPFERNPQIKNLTLVVISNHLNNKQK